MVDVRDDRDVAEIRRQAARRGVAGLGYLRGPPLGDAGLGPLLGDQERALHLRALVQLDPDLMHRRLHLAVGDRALLGHDRDRLHLAQQCVGEVVDLGPRGLAAGEHAEVDADVTVVVDERDLGEILHLQATVPAPKVL